MSMASASYSQYPSPLANYDEVVADPQLFMSSLEKLHSVMGTKFMIPIIGGRNLDLHKLFVEVTSRGGIEEVIREKRWKEVTSTFNFPSTATNASFQLRKYYYSLLHHYECIYYLKMQDCGPPSTGVLESSNTTPGLVHGLPKMPPAQAASVATTLQPRINTIEFVPGGAASSVGNSVIGVIDGKFDSGYLVTVKMGKDTLKGALYQAP
ncbi:high mobility group B protein 15-like isoform X1 [Silene latifolia]|uniref:high mobility group B protein 15-like isoform X1 n=1 Tax=Silene latifolia TaxID=37657 RepID=UPI003D77F099